MYYCQQHIPFYRLPNCLTGSGDEDDRDISPPSPAMMSMSLGREELDMPAMEDFKETVEKCKWVGGTCQFWHQAWPGVQGGLGGSQAGC